MKRNGSVIVLSCGISTVCVNLVTNFVCISQFGKRHCQLLSRKVNITSRKLPCVFNAIDFPDI